MNRWDVVRPDATRPPTVSGGNLNFPIDNGSLYQAGTTARNIVVQDLPSGAWEVTTKITVDPLTENYQQAGLRIYAGDENWASVHMIYAGTGRDFEFIYENNGTPRNEAADKLGGIPADAPLTYYVRLIRRRDADRRSTRTTAPRSARSGRPADWHVRQPEGRAGGAVRPGADLPRRALRLDPVRPGRADRRRWRRQLRRQLRRSRPRRRRGTWSVATSS